jgi:tetratricopeptide (TPR) repeat protein
MRLAPLLARLRKYVEAAAAFDEVLKIDPDSFAGLMGAGEMRLLMRDPITAERHYRRAVEVAPSAATPVAILAVMAAQRRNAEEARELAARAEALSPGIVGAQMALARADFSKGRRPSPRRA